MDYSSFILFFILGNVRSRYRNSMVPQLLNPIEY